MEAQGGTMFAIARLGRQREGSPILSLTFQVGGTILTEQVFNARYEVLDPRVPSITPLSYCCHLASRGVRCPHGLASVGLGGEPIAGVPRRQGGAPRACRASPMG